MTRLEIFDPAMCCATGVCGPQVEPSLAQFEADLRWLSTQGTEVTRRNLGQEPGAFVANPLVSSILQSGGEDALPVILLDGKLRWTGHYPTRDEMAATIGVSVSVAPEGAPAGSCCPPAEAATGCW